MQKKYLTNAVQHCILNIIILLLVHRCNLEEGFGCFCSIWYVHLDTEKSRNIYWWPPCLTLSNCTLCIQGICPVFTCCSISNALLAPSLSSLSGDGKLRKDETSGGRGADAGVDNWGEGDRKESQLNHNTKQTRKQQLAWPLDWTSCHMCRLTLLCMAT